jgi:chromosome segregation ATPase
MAGTDFFDDDLIRPRDSAKRVKLGPVDESNERTGESPASGDAPPRPVSDFNLTRMARHRKEVDAQSAIAAQELERLRKRQEQLEQERRELEDLRRRQDEYERGKREITELLKRSLVALERKEVDAQRMVELLSTTRARFKELLSDIEGLQEEGWPEDRIRDELAKSLGILEQARMEYNKAIAKIDAVKLDTPAAQATTPAVIYDERALASDEERSFVQWLKIGLAVSLPVTAAILIVGLLFFFVIYAGYI